MANDSTEVTPEMSLNAVSMPILLQLNRGGKTAGCTLRGSERQTCRSAQEQVVRLPKSRLRLRDSDGMVTRSKPSKCVLCD